MCENKKCFCFILWCLFTKRIRELFSIYINKKGKEYFSQKCHLVVEFYGIFSEEGWRNIFCYHYCVFIDIFHEIVDAKFLSTM